MLPIFGFICFRNNLLDQCYHRPDRIEDRYGATRDETGKGEVSKKCKYIVLSLLASTNEISKLIDQIDSTIVVSKLITAIFHSGYSILRFRQIFN